MLDRLKSEAIFFYYKMRSFWGRALDLMLFLDHLTSDTKSKVLNPPKTPLIGNKVAIYVTHRDLHHDEWEKNLFNALNELGFEIVIGINSPKQMISKDYLYRENFGYDIAASRDILNLYEQLPEEVFLINSSTAWSNAATLILQKARTAAKKSEADVIFATQSFQIQEHGQSFFIYAARNGVEPLRNALGRTRNWKTKRATVCYGELELARFCGLYTGKVGYLFEYELLQKQFMLNVHSGDLTYRLIQKGLKVNPSQHLWRELLAEGANFVKRNLVSSNPARLNKPPRSISQALKINRK
jgi:hypothetical protein